FGGVLVGLRPLDGLGLGDGEHPPVLDAPLEPGGDQVLRLGYVFVGDPVARGHVGPPRHGPADDGETDENGDHAVPIRRFVHGVRSFREAMDFARLPFGLDGGEGELLVHRADLPQVGFAQRALLQRLDDHGGPVLAGLGEAQDRALAVGTRLELVVGLEVGELEVDRVRRDGLLLGRVAPLRAQVLDLEAGREDVDLADHVAHLGVAVPAHQLGLEDVVGQDVVDLLGMAKDLVDLVHGRIDARDEAHVPGVIRARDALRGDLGGRAAQHLLDAVILPADVAGQGQYDDGDDSEESLHWGTGSLDQNWYVN